MSLTIAFRRNTNFKQIIGINTTKRNKKLIKSINKVNGKCSPSISNMKTFCCKQVISTASFRSSQTKRTFKISHYINCKKIYVIYLFECDLYKIQYAGSSETFLTSVLLILEKRLRTQTQNWLINILPYQDTTLTTMLILHYWDNNEDKTSDNRKSKWKSEKSQKFLGKKNLSQKRHLSLMGSIKLHYWHAVSNVQPYFSALHNS